MSYTISYPVRDSNGFDNYWMEQAIAEAEARARASAASRRHGHATITDRAGMVATYVNGAEWHGSTTATSTEEAQP